MSENHFRIPFPYQPNLTSQTAHLTSFVIGREGENLANDTIRVKFMSTGKDVKWSVFGKVSESVNTFFENGMIATIIETVITLE